MWELVAHQATTFGQIRLAAPGLRELKGPPGRALDTDFTKSRANEGFSHWLTNGLRSHILCYSCVRVANNVSFSRLSRHCRLDDVVGQTCLESNIEDNEARWNRLPCWYRVEILTLPQYYNYNTYTRPSMPIRGEWSMTNNKASPYTVLPHDHLYPIAAKCPRCSNNRPEAQHDSRVPQSATKKCLALRLLGHVDTRVEYSDSEE